MRYPGEVYFLPPDAAEDGDPKVRRHVLLTQCTDESLYCTFAFASTSGAEAAFGATSYLVDPYATAYRGTGFVQPTYVYTTRLVTVGVEHMERSVGRLIDDMVPLRDDLRGGLGLGTGTSSGTGPAAGSLRGHLVSLSGAFAADIGTNWGVLATEPRYSLARRYQLVVPLLDADEYEAATDDVLVENDTQVLGFTGWSGALMAVPVINTVFEPQGSMTLVGQVISEALMRDMDDALVRYFGL